MKKFIKTMIEWFARVGLDCIIILGIGLVLRIVVPGVIGGRLLEYSIVAFLTLNVSVIREMILNWYNRQL